MLCLDQNKQTVYYALYSGKTELTDSYGNKTGEYTVTRSTPVKARMNVSASRGAADTEMFGINDAYSKTIVTDDMTTAFDTATVWWIGKTPNNDGTDFNFVTVRVAKSLNSVTIAISEANISV